MHDGMFVVDAFATIQNFQIVFSGIMQFDHIAFRSIEDRLELVTLICVAGSQPILELIANFSCGRELAVPSNNPFSGSEELEAKA